MASTVALFVIALFINSAQAHYRFSHLIVNQTVTDEWKYVRDTSPDPTAKPLFSVPDHNWFKIQPQYVPSILDPNIRCGLDAWMPRPNGTARLTETADVAAGSEIGFRVGRNNDEVEAYIFHPGPGQVYLARVPDSTPLSSWDGDGDYFKIAYAGVTNLTEWELWHPFAGGDVRDFKFTIPERTPPGEYLLRVEHIFPHEGNLTQFFVNCAQIRVWGKGGGSPSEFARFPGTYKLDEPGVRIPDNMEKVIYRDFYKYGPAPGPPVWNGL